MSRNGTGTYSLPAGNPVVTGTTITSTWANNTLSDIATALTGSVASDGQTTMTGPLNMGSNKIQNIANGTLSTDVVNLGQLSAPAITGGSIDNCPIGATTPSTGAFTTLAASGATTLSSTLGVTGAATLSSTLAVTGATTYAADATYNGTGQIKMPAGTVAQRSGSPVNGMLRYNSDYSRFEGYAGGSWGGLGGASGASGNAVFYENDTTVTASYTITTGKNAMSAGPITIDTGVTVTVPDNSTWVIV